MTTTKISLTFLKVFIGSLLVTFASAAFAGPTRGGGSDGGGNSYKGRPLESYAKNPAQLPAFQQFILPLLSDIRGKAQHNDRMNVLANLLQSVFTQKIWYFVPGPLDQVPDELLNSAVRTDQAALQGFDRVWIDEDIWKGMSIEDQGKLMLHEVMMGLKILRFATALRQCIAGYGDAKSCGDHARLPDGKIRLEQFDYVDVQKLTLLVWSDFRSMDFKAWSEAFDARGIRFYLDWFERTKPMSLQEFDQRLRKAVLSGFLPTQGYNLRLFDTEKRPPVKTPNDVYKYFQKNKQACKVNVSIQGHAINLEIQSPDPLKASFQLPDELETSARNPLDEKRTLTTVRIPWKTGKARPQGGYTLFNSFMAFDGFELAHVYVQEMVCEKADCSTGYFDVKGGMTYICSDNSQLFKPE